MVDLTRLLGLAQSTVSQHLACLRDCGLVELRTEGRQSYYSLTRPELIDLLRSAELLLAETVMPWRCARCTASRRPRWRRRESTVPIALPLGERCCAAGSGCSSPRRSPTTSIEAVVAIIAGTLASSVALIGFGLDSVIEVSSAAAVAWQFAGRDPARREQVALRVIAWSFFALAAFVTVESLRTLFGEREAEQSVVGIVLVATSVVIMPFLSYAQRRSGRELGSASAVADSRQTLLCTYLSAAVLVGLVLNASLGWWWADPAAALVLAVLAVREGRNAWRGDLVLRDTRRCGCRTGRDRLCGGVLFVLSGGRSCRAGLRGGADDGNRTRVFSLGS